MRIALPGRGGLRKSDCVSCEQDFGALLAEHKEMNAGLTDNAASELASMPDEMDAVMRLHVRRVFDKYGQNLSKTAEALKVARNTVRRYL